MFYLIKKRKKQTQLLMVLNHLKKGKSITPIEALNKYGCFRLSAVIHKLRNKHHFNISTDRSKGYAIYTLKSKKPLFS